MGVLHCDPASQVQTDDGAQPFSIGTRKALSSQLGDDKHPQAMKDASVGLLLLIPKSYSRRAESEIRNDVSILSLHRRDRKTKTKTAATRLEVGKKVVPVKSYERITYAIYPLSGLSERFRLA
jgi:hypothetical protein